VLKSLASLLISLACIYCTVLAVLWWKQESLLFYPSPLPAEHRFATGPGIHELSVPVEGATLSVLQTKLPESKGVVFFLHGNAGNLDSWFAEADFFRAARFDVVMPDYRGYGKSTGRIATAHQLRDDVRKAWEHVAAQYRGQRVVIAGRSLGTALAADLAEQLAREGRPPDLTVLVSPYFSMRDMTRDHYPWVPTALLRYPLDTSLHLPQVPGAILLLHGASDELIAPRHAQRLHALVPRARLVLVPGAGHNDIADFPLYQQELNAALARL
jgi:pimeloyl-ACP methyl ester carboxylesterase